MSPCRCTRSRLLAVLLAGAASQGCLSWAELTQPSNATVAPPPEASFEGPGIEGGEVPEDMLSGEEELLLDEALRSLLDGEDGSLLPGDHRLETFAERFPGMRSAVVIEELLERRVALLAEGKARRREADAHLEPDPEAARQAFLDARLLAEQGRKEDACAHLEKARALDPDDQEVEEALVSLCKELGLELYGKGNSVKAAVFWKRALEIRPDDADAQKFLLRANRVNGNR